MLDQRRRRWADVIQMFCVYWEGHVTKLRGAGLKADQDSSIACVSSKHRHWPTVGPLSTVHCLRRWPNISSIPRVSGDSESHWDQRAISAYYITRYLRPSHTTRANRLYMLYALFFTVIEELQIPVNLKLEATSSIAITVSYEWPYQQAVSFQVKYEHGDDPPVLRDVMSREYVYMAGFEAATFYNVSVRAVRLGRESPFSDKILAITGKIPGVPPVKIWKLWLFKHALIFIRELNPYSAGIDFSRQNLTSADVRFSRLKSISAL